MPARELRIPDGAREGPHADEAVELIRAFWVHDRPEFVLSAALKDPRNIGRMLGEAAVHDSQVDASKAHGEAEALLEQIRLGWDDAKGIPMKTVMAHGQAPKEG